MPSTSSVAYVRLDNYNPALVSPTVYRVLPPIPTATLYQPPQAIRVGTNLQFLGRLQEVTSMTFTDAVTLTQGWTVASAATSQYLNSNSWNDVLKIMVPSGAVAGSVTFTTRREA